jgi:hypothetical protein
MILNFYFKRQGVFVFITLVSYIKNYRKIKYLDANINRILHVYINEFIT